MGKIIDYIISYLILAFLFLLGITLILGTLAGVLVLVIKVSPWFLLLLILWPPFVVIGFRASCYSLSELVDLLVGGD